MKTWQRVQLGSVLAAIDFDLEGLFGLDYVVLQYRCTSTVGRVNEIQTAENLKSNSASAKPFFIERRRVEREARTGGVKMKKKHRHNQNQEGEVTMVTRGTSLAGCGGVIES